ncbi:MAG: hypothetical protein HOQ28_11115 [Thermoleophilia bacterium]|nr:hypothetical protein [Thermoleophilia bacterium]
MSNWDAGATLLLGAFHGLNPAMGWLFAVAIGFQAQARRAVVGALGPIAVGHLASMAFTVLVVEELRVLSSEATIRIAGALALAAFASWRIASSHRHPRWVGMCLRRRELALWSFLMSTAHGAGLMLIPVVVGLHVNAHDHMLMPSSLGPVTAVLLVHTVAMVAVAGAIAVAVYEFLGVGVLRRGWINLDRVWAYALGAGAAATLLIA